VGGEPVAAGLVASLARPCGNLTGMVFMTGELVPKRLELLSELVSQAKAIALLVNPNNPAARESSEIWPHSSSLEVRAARTRSFG
jgi:putative ABC transport system substrate-binding protein